MRVQPALEAEMEDLMINQKAAPTLVEQPIKIGRGKYIPSPKRTFTNQLLVLHAIVAQRFHGETFAVIDLLYRHPFFGGRSEDSYVATSDNDGYDLDDDTNVAEELIIHREIDVDKDEEVQLIVDIEAFLMTAVARGFVVFVDHILYRLRYSDAEIFAKCTESELYDVRKSFWDVCTLLGTDAFQEYKSSDICVSSGYHPFVNGSTGINHVQFVEAGLRIGFLQEMTPPNKSRFLPESGKIVLIAKKYRFNPEILQKLGIRPESEVEMDIIGGAAMPARSDFEGLLAVILDTLGEDKVRTGFVSKDLYGPGKLYQYSFEAGATIDGLSSNGHLKRNESDTGWIFSRFPKSERPVETAVPQTPSKSGLGLKMRDGRIVFPEMDRSVFGGTRDFLWRTQQIEKQFPADQAFERSVLVSGLVGNSKDKFKLFATEAAFDKYYANAEEFELVYREVGEGGVPDKFGISSQKLMHGLIGGHLIRRTSKPPAVRSIRLAAPTPPEFAPVQPVAPTPPAVVLAPAVEKPFLKPEVVVLLEEPVRPKPMPVSVPSPVKLLPPRIVQARPLAPAVLPVVTPPAVVPSPIKSFELIPVDLDGMFNLVGKLDAEIEQLRKDVTFARSERDAATALITELQAAARATLASHEEEKMRLRAENVELSFKVDFQAKSLARKDEILNPFKRFMGLLMEDALADKLMGK